jgi:hypothetical protein
VDDELELGDTSWDDLDVGLRDVLESAARLQEAVPDAVLVGGSAAALRAGHRASYDHDHVVGDLRDRFDAVLDAIEREGDWVTNRVRPGKIILGELGDIEAGVRQLIRTTPLETQRVRLPSGRWLVVPTADETLRIKGFLIVKRNQVRDYLDVAALSVRYGLGHAASVLAQLDRFYTDDGSDQVAAASQLATQLAEPRPADSRVIAQLSNYKALEPRWQNWATVVEVCRELAARMVTEDWGD